MSKNLDNIALALDVRGSILSTTATSTLARGASYDIWGVPKGAATTDPQLGYRGELTIDTLIHLRNRDYNPANPEFTSRDRITGQAGQPAIANPYQYALNDPVANTDPLGLFPSDRDLNETACGRAGGIQYNAHSHTCYLPPVGLSAGAPCRPPVTPDGKPVVWGPDGGCGVWVATNGGVCLTPLNSKCRSLGEQHPLLTEALIDTAFLSLTVASFGLSAELAAGALPGVVAVNATEGGVAVGEPTGRLVIGKVPDLQADGTLNPGERTLLDQLPKQPSPATNWSQNAGSLRYEMGLGHAIRDATVDPITGELVNNTGFLRAERSLLEAHGWTFDPKTMLWSPP